jgi:D-glycero-alpha-D-manno-heptose-7-phosphate kinase
VIIVRAPVRLSLAGGGTDLPAYYETYGGLVVSTTIDKYFYVFVNVANGRDVQISSSDYRVFHRHRAGEPPLWDGDLGLVKAALHEFGCEAGITLFLASEIPPGTGLGSSSAVAVALVKALSTLQGRRLSAAQVAERACALEIEKCQAPIGKQDQYASAYGGLNVFRFSADGVEVESPSVSSQTMRQLEQNLLLFFTGSTRNANSVLREQRERTAELQSETVQSLHVLKDAAERIRRCLESGDLGGFGVLLDETWQHKKRLARNVTNPRIDELYALARSKGAAGGKIAGAGGGGFLMLYCEKLKQPNVIPALEAEGLYRMDYRLERGGCQVLMNSLSWSHPAFMVADDAVRLA